MPPVPFKEAQRRLGGVSRGTIYNLVADGSLRLVRIRGRVLIPAEDIDALIGRSLA